MAFKIFLLATFLATAANAGYLAPAQYAYAAPAVAKLAAPVAYAAPVATKVAAPIAIAKSVDPNYDPNPQYSYAYNVQDGITGDNKQQQEIRNGDSVQGSYSLIEADGTRRTVEYTADSVNGFNAVIHREPAAIAVKAAPVVAKVATPVAYAAPAAPLSYVAHATPLAYAAPAAPPAKLAYAAPAAPVLAAAPVAKIATPLYH